MTCHPFKTREWPDVFPIEPLGTIEIESKYKSVREHASVNVIRKLSDIFPA